MSRTMLIKAAYGLLVVGLFVASVATSRANDRPGCLDASVRRDVARVLETNDAADYCYPLERSLLIAGIPVEIHGAEATTSEDDAPFRRSEISKAAFFAENSINVYEREWPELHATRPIVIVLPRVDGLDVDADGDTFGGFQSLARRVDGEEVCLITLAPDYVEKVSEFKQASIAHEVFHCYQEQMKTANKASFVIEGSAEYASTLVAGPEPFSDPLDAPIDEPVGLDQYNAYDQWLLWDHLAATRSSAEILAMWRSIDTLDDLKSEISPEEFHEFVLDAVFYRLPGRNGTSYPEAHEVELSSLSGPVTGVGNADRHLGSAFITAPSGAIVEVVVSGGIVATQFDGASIDGPTALCGDYDALYVLWSAIDPTDVDERSLTILSEPDPTCDPDEESPGYDD